MCLHSLSGLTSESKHPYGAEPSPFDYDPFIAGHLQFELGEFKVSGSAESAQSGQRVPAGNGDWKTRYDEHNTEVRAFSLYSDFCARGDKITDEAFKEFHGPWKERYCEMTANIQGGRYHPTVTLHSVAPIPVDRVVRLCYESLFTDSANSSRKFRRVEDKAGGQSGKALTQPQYLRISSVAAAPCKCTAVWHQVA